jgi:hypothetical protein
MKYYALSATRSVIKIFNSYCHGIAENIIKQKLRPKTVARSCLQIPQMVTIVDSPLDGYTIVI